MYISAMSDLRVELLAVEDCPHFERTRKNLETVLREGIIETPIQVVFVTSEEDAEFLQFPGSPTIRINGEDVVPEPGLPAGLGCRIYRDESGERIDGPPVERIRDAVAAHRRGRLAAFQREEAGRVASFARAAAEAEDDTSPDEGGSAASIAPDATADTSLDRHVAHEGDR